MTLRSYSMRPSMMIIHVAIAITVLLLWTYKECNSFKHGKINTGSNPTIGTLESDEMTTLPGWKGPLPSKWYAGYVDAGSDVQYGHKYDMFMHYIYVESERSPENDPLIIWTNGGPGAASYFGLFIELGPLFLSAQSFMTDEYKASGIPTLFRREYSWSSLANILILNGPPPVGYSYCDPIGPAGDGFSCGDWDDERTAYHNAIVVENFIKYKLPRYNGNPKDVYIIGESYAGVYVPTLFRELRKRSTEQSNDMYNLKGFAIGDCCMGTQVNCGSYGNGPYYHIEFFRGHGQFSEITYKFIYESCSMDELLGFGHPISKSCGVALDKMKNEIGGFYAYSLYDDCWYQNDLEPPHIKHNNENGTMSRSYWGPPVRHVRTKHPTNVAKEIYNQQSAHYPCGGPQALFEWIETDAVKSALNVDADAYFFSGDNGIGFNYTTTEPNLLPYLQELVYSNTMYDRASADSTRIMVYNGDTDPSLNSLAAENWTSSLGFDVLESWRPYTIDNSSYVGGYITRYHGNFDFVTIRGSGHMVPEYQGHVMLAVLEKWLLNEDLYHYYPNKNSLMTEFSFSNSSLPF